VVSPAVLPYHLMGANNSDVDTLAVHRFQIKWPQDLTLIAQPCFGILNNSSTVNSRRMVPSNYDSTNHFISKTKHMDRKCFFAKFVPLKQLMEGTNANESQISVQLLH
jgi:hypothetical protein